LAGKKDRDRRRARERYERQREQRNQRRQKIRQRASIGGAVVLVLGLIAGLTIAFAGGGSPKASSSPSAKATASKSASATPTPSTSTSAPPIAEPAHHCTYTAGGISAKKVGLPSATPDYNATYTATINTNLGKIEIALANSKATCTVNSFVHLASADFWNASQCHRVTTSGIYVLQCGDPFAKAADKLTCSQGSNSPGTGGPGYQFDNENLVGATYKAGTVAMANSGTGTNGSGTNGSQFFLVYKNTALPAQYTPFGTITAGMDILQKVANAGTSCTYGSPGDGAPKEKVIIDSVTIKKT
jgi:peptidyl-prolyl cis-trans isomerase B (cyclophilin B)